MGCRIMEMEHINENTIRVLIESADLEERGVTFLDLLGNHKQIENFFYSILEEVDVDEQFHESDAITFQVLPNGNGLELFISKGGPLNDQLDFSSASEDLNSDEFSQYIKKQMIQNAEKSDNKTDEYVSHTEDETKEIVLKFNEFEDMIELSKMMHLDNAVTNLFLYKDIYYLNLIFFIDELTERSADEEIALALEFADKTSVTQWILEEHGKLIMEKNALELTRHYFK